MKNLKKNISSILIMMIGFYFIYEYLSNKNKIENLDYGIKANYLRKSLRIPLIDENMTTDNTSQLLGHVWHASKKEPKQGEILHIWKKVMPLDSDKFILNEEIDAYRMIDSNNRIKQLNIYNKIVNDSISLKTGKIFFTTIPKNELNLNEKGVDSILKNLEH